MGTPTGALRPLLALAGVLLLGGSACAHPSAVGRYAQVRGIRMYYELHGHGSPLLLIHGGAGNGMQFENQIPAFSPHHRLIIPDCCAQGRTTDRPGPLTYHGMAEDMIALLDHLHVRRADIMGWSDGGIIALDMAMNHPDRVGRVVTFGANFTPDGLNPQDVEWNRTATAESFGADMKAGWQKLSPQPDHYEAAMNKILDMWRSQPDWSVEQLHRIRARCLICAGDRDLIRPEHTAQLANAIPDAEMWIVPNASHSAMIERFDLVNPRVLAFLRR